MPWSKVAFFFFSDGHPTFNDGILIMGIKTVTELG